MDALNIKIKGLRIKKGLKQEDVAEKIGMTQSNYARLESGKADFKYERLAQIAEVFEMTVGTLIDYNGMEDLPEDGKFYFTDLQIKIKDIEKLQTKLDALEGEYNQENNDLIEENDKLKDEGKDLKKRIKDFEVRLTDEKNKWTDDLKNTKDYYERLITEKERLIVEKERTINTLEKLILKL
jgi:transcriptional regulator with XRE-family HTH domain